MSGKDVLRLLLIPFAHFAKRNYQKNNSNQFKYE